MLTIYPYVAQLSFVDASTSLGSPFLDRSHDTPRWICGLPHAKNFRSIFGCGTLYDESLNPTVRLTSKSEQRDGRMKVTLVYSLWQFYFPSKLNSKDLTY